MDIQAQNANKSGVFVEFGVGGYVGSTPRSEIGFIDDNLMFKCQSGGAFSIGYGYRLKFCPHWAYEVKAEGQTAFNNPIHALVGRFVPVGFRYTSVEVWRNFSLYAHANIGAAIAVQSVKNVNHTGQFDNQFNIISDDTDNKIKGHRGSERFGLAHSLGVGVNLTTHFYTEVSYSGQTMFNASGKNGKGTLTYGYFGAILGYRF